MVVQEKNNAMVRSPSNFTFSHPEFCPADMPKNNRSLQCRHGKTQHFRVRRWCNHQEKHLIISHRLMVGWIHLDLPTKNYPSILQRIDGCQMVPSGYVKIAIENCHRNSGFAHWKWWFSIVVGQFTRGYITSIQQTTYCTDAPLNPWWKFHYQKPRHYFTTRNHPKESLKALYQIP